MTTHQRAATATAARTPPAPAAPHFPGAKFVEPGPIFRAHYTSDRTRTALVVVRGGGRQDDSKLTVNPTEPIAVDEVAIKSWSENVGVYEALVAAGIVAPAHRIIPQGFCDAQVCRLLVAVPEIEA